MRWPPLRAAVPLLASRDGVRLGSGGSGSFQGPHTRVVREAASRFARRAASEETERARRGARARLSRRRGGLGRWREGGGGGANIDICR